MITEHRLLVNMAYPMVFLEFAEALLCIQIRYIEMVKETFSIHNELSAKDVGLLAEENRRKEPKHLANNLTHPSKTAMFSEKYIIMPNIIFSSKVKGRMTSRPCSATSSDRGSENYSFI